MKLLIYHLFISLSLLITKVYKKCYITMVYYDDDHNMLNNDETEKLCTGKPMHLMPKVEVAVLFCMYEFGVLLVFLVSFSILG